jgi:two-component system, LytTR family, response regulator
MDEPRLRAVIVDDEAPARALLVEYLGELAGVEVVGECANGFEAVKRIDELAPDVVFLDVQMPKLDGFEVLELIEPGPSIVFCTAYDEFALRAFEVHAVDYLLKPFGLERVAAALQRVRQARRAAPGAGASAPPAELAAAARGPGRHLERIVVRDSGAVHVIPIDRVDLLEAQDDYVAIHSEGRSWLKAQPLTTLAESLDPQRFVRVHRSYVVNLERVERLELYAKDSRVAILRDGREVPVSRSGWQRLRECMDA